MIDCCAENIGGHGLTCCVRVGLDRDGDGAGMAVDSRNRERTQFYTKFDHQRP
jgi:hypothetical protein